MDWALWAGFVIASLIVGLLPGPGVTSIVGYALTSGLRTALASVFGATAGNATAMAFSLAGVGVLVERYPAAFLVLKPPFGTRVREVRISDAPTLSSTSSWLGRAPTAPTTVAAATRVTQTVRAMSRKRATLSPRHAGPKSHGENGAC
jgi:hypothetical protein